MTPCPRAAQLWAAEGWLRTTERFHWMQNHTTSSAGQLLRKASLPLASEGCVRSSRWVLLVLVLFRCSAGLQLAQCARCLGESNTDDATSLSFDFVRFVGVSNLRVAVSQRTLRETPLQLPAEKGGAEGRVSPSPAHLLPIARDQTVLSKPVCNSVRFLRARHSTHPRHMVAKQPACGNCATLSDKDTFKGLLASSDRRTGQHQSHSRVNGSAITALGSS